MVSLHILPSPQRRDSQSGIPSLVWGAGEYLDTASGKDWSPQGRGPCCSLSAAVTGASPQRHLEYDLGLGSSHHASTTWEAAVP